VAQEDIHWVRGDLALRPGETLSIQARIRYRQALQKATLFQTESALYVSFDEPQSAITSGQFVAWYHEKELLGSGVIT
ncbi:tRNA 2-thiouridine(34) synthase MnmA, partial [Flavobacteriaceae bacterium]|nr:tRNA 2-thiouridine(34) synthase MnmA [Flavobacteriaceae bacterium]